MNLKIGKQVVALLCSLLCASYVCAQQFGQPGSNALRIYYSDLYEQLSVYEINDVPFKYQKIKVREGDSLIGIAKRHSFKELDLFHLAAAIYEINTSSFSNGRAEKLSVGDTLTLPNIGDLIFAQDRYEKLKVAGRSIDFNNKDNQMQTALRWPFDKSLIHTDPQSKDELPGNQVVTLTSHSVDTIASVTPRIEPTKGLTKPNNSSLPNTIDLAAANNEQTVRVNSSTLPHAPATIDDQTLLAGTRKDKPVVTLNLTPEKIKTAAIAAAAPDVNHKAEKLVERKSSLAVAATTPQSTAVTANSVNQDYLGPPRDSSMPLTHDNPTDPLNYTIEWAFDQGTTVGVALSQLADYIGYELASDHDVVLKAFERRLPAVQRQISDVSVAAGFEILAGRGLQTQFDHVTRTIRHTPQNFSRMPSTKHAIPPHATIAEVGKSVIEYTPKDTNPETPYNTDDIYAELLEHAGVTTILQHFPADILNAAEQHANRCKSNPGLTVPTTQHLSRMIVSRLQQNQPRPTVRSLVEWYQSPTGRKVLALGQSATDETQKQFKPKARRAEQIEQVYDNTISGKGIAGIAIELNYAGWSLSGCMQKAEQSGNSQDIQKENHYAQNIRGKRARLETQLRTDNLESMTLQLAPLSDKEMTQYSAIVREHAGLLAELQQSIIETIEKETREISVSSLGN